MPAFAEQAGHAYVCLVTEYGYELIRDMLDAGTAFCHSGIFRWIRGIILPI